MEGIGINLWQTCRNTPTQEKTRTRDAKSDFTSQIISNPGLNAETFKSQYTKVFINSKGYYLGTSPDGMDIIYPARCTQEYDLGGPRIQGHLRPQTECLISLG